MFLRYTLMDAVSVLRREASSHLEQVTQSGRLLFGQSVQQLSQCVSPLTRHDYMETERFSFRRYGALATAPHW